MPDRKARADAEGLHTRLVWLIGRCDQSRSEVAAGLGRNQGTITPWFAHADWSLPDAKGLMGLLGCCTIGGEPVSARWLMTGEGAPTEAPKKESATVFRGAQLLLADLEVWLLRRRERLAEQEAAATPHSSEIPGGGVDPRSVAARLAETDAAHRKVHQPAPRRHRRSG